MQQEINHSLHLGDCNEVFSQIKDKSVDLVITDPPFGISYKSNRQRVDRKKSVKGYGSVVVRDHYFNHIQEDDKLPLKWLIDAYRVLKDNCAIYIFTHWKKWHELFPAVESAGFSVKNMIVMNKSNHGMGNLRHWAGKHELLLFATKGKHELSFPKGRKNDIWNVPVKFSGSKRFHPNEKPIDWLVPIIENSSKEKDVILDPFMGSGTTGVASIRMSRQFIGIEKDTEYFYIAEKRIEAAMQNVDFAPC